MVNQPRRRSPRLRDYDYTRSGMYFVTICTHQRRHIFGHINDAGNMIISPEGRVAETHWHSIPDHFAAVELDAFAVMPNHIHGILIFGEHGSGGHGSAVSLPGESFGKPVKGSLSTVIRSYKSIVTRTIREIKGADVIVWQGRYHDHIIRNETSLNHIRQYVMSNPALWREDTFYSP